MSQSEPRPPGVQARLPDWDEGEETPHTVHLPAPTVWPCAAAAGVTLIAFGVVTTLAFSVAGAVLFALALAGWLGELLRE
jgi:hypothetical protein